jgi:two-component system sensor histidine kinase CreC
VVRIQTRIFIGVLVVVCIAFSSLLYWITDDLEPQYRKTTEEPLVDSARILAAVAADLSRDGQLDVSAFERVFQEVARTRFKAQIYDFDKESVDFRVYITDADGKVLFHSFEEGEVGKDYSLWNDVVLTLRGEYGARTTRDNPYDGTTSVMYVAAPIVLDGRTIGVLTVGKPTSASASIVDRAKRKIVYGGVTVLLSVILVVGFISTMTTRPIYRLTEYAREARDGKRVQLPDLKGAEVQELGNAFEEMRDALEGKKYIENYVQTLTHEVKSPLSAIHGAAELLREEMTEEQRRRFVENILTETRRIETVVEKLLLLSTLEARKGIGDVVGFTSGEIIHDVREAFMPRAVQKGVDLEVAGDMDCRLEGDRFLVRHALSNLLANAVEFSSEGGRVTISSEHTDDIVRFTVRDLGTGIPEYALDRVFERFYSLKRPDTGLKSSGLGLSLVREVASLHNGTINVQNAPEGGVIATFILPARQS